MHKYSTSFILCSAILLGLGGASAQNTRNIPTRAGQPGLLSSGSASSMVVEVPGKYPDEICTVRVVAMEYDYTSNPRKVRFTRAPGAEGKLFCPVVFRDGFGD